MYGYSCSYKMATLYKKQHSMVIVEENKKKEN